MLNVVILVGLGAFVVFIVGKLVVGYSKAEGSPWDRILAAASNSAVILKEMITAAGGAVLVWSDEAAQFFNMPEVQSFLKDHLTPGRMGTALTAIAIIGILARLRTLRKA